MQKSEASKQEIELSNVKLSTPTMEDIPLILDLDETAKKASTGSGFLPDQLEARRKVLERVIFGEDTTSKIYLMEVGDSEEKVGYLSVSAKPRPVESKIRALGLDLPNIDDSGNHWHITGFAVRAIDRGKGYLREAVELVGREAVKYNVQYITTDTGRNNYKVINALTRMGFDLYEDPFAEASGYFPGTKIFAIKILK